MLFCKNFICLSFASNHSVLLCLAVCHYHADICNKVCFKITVINWLKSLFCFILFIFLETKTMRDQLRVISVNSHNLTALSVDLQRGLNDAKDNLTNIQSNCSDINPPPNFCNEINTDGLDTQANFTNLPNVSRQLSNVEDVISQDFEKSANDVSCWSKIVLFLIAIHIQELSVIVQTYC